MFKVGNTYKNGYGADTLILITDGTSPKYPVIGMDVKTGNPRTYTQDGVFYVGDTDTRNNLIPPLVPHVGKVYEIGDGRIVKVFCIDEDPDHPVNVFSKDREIICLAPDVFVKEVTDQDIDLGFELKDGETYWHPAGGVEVTMSLVFPGDLFCFVGSDDDTYPAYSLGRFVRGFELDEKVWVRDGSDDQWVKRHFARREEGRLYAWCGGSTSHTEDGVTYWSEMTNKEPTC